MHLDPKDWPIIIVISKLEFSGDFHWLIDICLAR